MTASIERAEFSHPPVLEIPTVLLQGDAYDLATQLASQTAGIHLAVAPEAWVINTAELGPNTAAGMIKLLGGVVESYRNDRYFGFGVAELVNDLPDGNRDHYLLSGTSSGNSEHATQTRSTIQAEANALLLQLQSPLRLG